MRPATDWPALMRIGLHGLALAPAVFWDLTPAELMFLAMPGLGPGTITRTGLDELMGRFPDRKD
jgi:uncharacterized phage protein (TIGR02216 family)